MRCLLAAGFLFYTMEEYTVSSSHHGDCDRETHWRHHSSLLRRRSLLSRGFSLAFQSHKLVNAHKSCFMLASKAPARLRTLIANTTGYSTKEFPVKYLGIPLISGRCKKAFFVDKILRQVQGWRSSLLSAGGRLIFIKHVLSAIPMLRPWRGRLSKKVFTH